MAAHQALPSLGFSRQEHWSGLPFLSPMHESESEVIQSNLTLSDPMECNLPGSSIHGIFQARVLEWGTIAFSVQLFRSVFLNFKVFVKFSSFLLFLICSFITLCSEKISDIISIYLDLMTTRVQP